MERWTQNAEPGNGTRNVGTVNARIQALGRPEATGPRECVVGLVSLQQRVRRRRICGSALAASADSSTSHSYGLRIPPPQTDARSDVWVQQRRDCGVPTTEARRRSWTDSVAGVAEDAEGTGHQHRRVRRRAQPERLRVEGSHRDSRQQLENGQTQCRQRPPAGHAVSARRPLVPFCIQRSAFNVALNVDRSTFNVPFLVLSS